MELNGFLGQANIGPRDTGALPGHVQSKIDGGESAIKAIREWRQLSQADLADRTGVAITQIMRAETGGTVSVAALRLMARGLRVWDELVLDRR